MAQNHSDQDFQVPRTCMIDPVYILQLFFVTKKSMVLGHPKHVYTLMKNWQIQIMAIFTSKMTFFTMVKCIHYDRRDKAFHIQVRV